MLYFIIKFLWPASQVWHTEKITITTIFIQYKLNKSAPERKPKLGTKSNSLALFVLLVSALATRAIVNSKIFIFWWKLNRTKVFIQVEKNTRIRDGAQDLYTKCYARNSWKRLWHQFRPRLALWNTKSQDLLKKIIFAKGRMLSSKQLIIFYDLEWNFCIRVLSLFKNIRKWKVDRRKRGENLFKVWKVEKINW